MHDNRITLDSSGIVIPVETFNHTEKNNFKIICSDDEKTKTDEDAICKKKSNISKILKMEMNKPLIPLKIAMFCWFAASAALGPFIALYLKQRGLTLHQLSVIYIITPVIQIFGPSLSGIVADKLGRSKPVLQVSLLIVLLGANCLLLMTGVTNICVRLPVSCIAQTYDNASVMELCSIHENDSYVTNCVFNCSTEQSQEPISNICFLSYILSCNLGSQRYGYAIVNKTIEECTKDMPIDNDQVNNTFCDRHIVGNCSSACIVNTNNTQEEDKCQKTAEGRTVFILTLIIMVVFQAFVSNVYRIFDVTAMSMVKSYKSDFGQQRIWAIMGTMIFSPLSGYIISAVSPEIGPPRYDVPFYIYDVMVLITMFTVWKLDVEIDPPGKDMMKKCRMLIKNIDIVVFMILMLLIGTAWGFSKLFYSWFLEDLGAPSTLMGLVITVGALSGLPFLFTSNWFVNKFGSSNLLLFGLVGYTVWFIGYSFLVNPWYALIYQILEIPTYHLLWVTVVLYSHSIAPPGLRATVIATAGGIHYGIGKGTGSLIGGFIMSKYGGRMAYRVMAAICAATSVLYAIYIYYKKKSKKPDTDLKD